MFTIGYYEGGIWIGMLFMSMLMGLLSVILGIVMYKKPPKKINGLYGYRTSTSMKTQQTWDFAQKYAAKVMVKYGLICTALGGALYSTITLLVSGVKDLPTFFALGSVLVQAIGLTTTIFPVEKALKENFDEFGDRKTAD